MLLLLLWVHPFHDLITRCAYYKYKDFTFALMIVFSFGSMTAQLQRCNVFEGAANGVWLVPTIVICILVTSKSISSFDVTVMNYLTNRMIKHDRRAMDNSCLGHILWCGQHQPLVANTLEYWDGGAIHNLTGDDKRIVDETYTRTPCPTKGDQVRK